MAYTDRIDFKSLSICGVFECCASQTYIEGDRYIIICIYRPNTSPSCNIDIFFERFISLLDLCLVENVRFIIAGDFNIDLLSSTAESKTFLQYCRLVIYKYLQQNLPE